MSLMTMFVLAAGAQSTIDKIFDKYQGKDGFVTITINGNLLKMMSAFDNDEDEFLRHADKFTTIRILAEEDEGGTDENFYDLVIGEVSKGGYEEMVTINSNDADVKILVKADGKIFTEFLLIAGGDDNAIIQIKGKLSLDEVKEMSESVRSEHGVHISGLYN